MPVPRVFAAASRTISKSMIGHPCVITMDGTAYPTRAMFASHQRPLEKYDQTFAEAEPRMWFVSQSLPREPYEGDVIEFENGERWKIGADPAEDHSTGLVVFRVIRLRA